MADTTAVQPDTTGSWPAMLRLDASAAWQRMAYGTGSLSITSLAMDGLQRLKSKSNNTVTVNSSGVVTSLQLLTVHNNAHTTVQCCLTAKAGPRPTNRMEGQRETLDSHGQYCDGRNDMHQRP